LVENIQLKNLTFQSIEVIFDTLPLQKILPHIDKESLFTALSKIQNDATEKQKVEKILKLFENSPSDVGVSADADVL